MNTRFGIGIAAGLSLLLLSERVNTFAQPGSAAQSATADRGVVWDVLAAKAATGPIRVIVGVAKRIVPEGSLGDTAAIAEQRSEIAAAQDAVLALVPARLLGTVKRFRTIPYMALEADAATLAAFRASTAVTSIEEDGLDRASLATSIPFIGASTAWAAGYTGAGWAVAVLDSGVDRTHPFLAGKVVSEACYSTTSADSSSICPGGVTSSTAIGSGVNCAFEGCEHGTHVAGIAAGRGTGFSGVGRDAGVIAVQVFSFITSLGDIASFTSDQILGLERVLALSATARIAAVNMSLGGGMFTSQATCDASHASRKAIIDQLRSVNIATVVASGNNGFINATSAPACISTVVSVGSVTDGALGTTSDEVSVFSNSASFVSLLAPGEAINSSIPSGGFAVFDGTSMAAPHVAGTWALLKQANTSATVAHALSILQGTGKPVFEAASGLTRPRILVAPAVGFLGSEGTRYDYTADHVAEAAVYRTSTGQWFVNGVTSVLWGLPAAADVPVPADYNGDRRTDIAVYRASTGVWYPLGLAAVAWGLPAAGDLPVPADYNGDRIADIAVYRATTGQWFLRGLGTFAWGDPAQNDTPVAADYDGDGRTDIAVYRRTTGQWFVLRSTGGVSVTSWGLPAQNDLPVPADYDGDGKADIAVYRPASGTWFVLLAAGGIQVTTWGVQGLGDVPVPADYNADGRADVAVYRPSSGQWFVRNVATINWGDPTKGDIPAR